MCQSLVIFSSITQRFLNALKKIEKKLIEEYKPTCNFLKKSIKKNNKINCKDVLKTLDKEIDSKRLPV